MRIKDGGLDKNGNIICYQQKDLVKLLLKFNLAWSDDDGTK